MKFYLAAVCISLCIPFTVHAQYQARLNFGAKHEPSGKILHGAGQSNDIEFSSYAAYLGNEAYPTIYMFYTTAKRPIDRQRDQLNRKLAFIDENPTGVIPQIGLSFTDKSSGSPVHYADEVVAGDHDATLIAFAETLNIWNKPAFVRIGYEANGSWNGYQPASYKEAFRYITDLFRARAPKIATVWCIHPEIKNNLTNIMTYYPGDNWVDWWAIDLFQPKYLGPNSNTQLFLDEAVSHSKPVMIGESCPAEVEVNDGQADWNSWFKPYFNIIKNNPGIKAFCYINRNWRANKNLSEWGDGRMFINQTVGSLYKAELSNAIFKHLAVDNDYGLAAISPSEDAYVRDGTYSGTNYNSSSIKVKRSTTAGFTREGYMRFETASISNVTSARLWVFIRNNNNDRLTTNIHKTSDAVWNEASLTWDNKPSLGNLLGEVTITKDANKWRSIDVTNYVKNNQGGAVGFAFVNKLADERTITIDAKENTKGNVAFLVIYYQKNSSNTGNNVFPRAGAYYYMRHVNSERYLDTNADKLVNTRLSKNGNDRQWSFYANGSVYGIINRGTNRGALDTSNDGKVQWVTTATPSSADKLWEMVEAGNNRYYFRNQEDNKDWLAANGSGDVFWTNANTPPSSALWQVELVGGSNARVATQDTKEVFIANEGDDSPGTEVSMYPNPASQTVAVHLPVSEDRALVTLLDLTGREMLHQWQGDGSEVRLSVQSLPQGVYRVRVQQANQVIVRKLLIE